MIRPFPIQDVSQGFAAAVGQSVNNSHLMGGKGVKIQRHNNATSINVAFPRMGNDMNYKGVFSFDGQYDINDVVYVDPTVTYPVPFSSSTVAPLTPGLFICLFPVCPQGYNETFFINSVVPSFVTASQTATDDLANSFQWPQYNIYYPTYPGIPTSSVTTVADGSGYNIVANLNYWAPLMPMFQSTTCQSDGTFQSIWISGVTASGSFNMSTLPYHT